jgi:hypothetical protein
MNSPENSLDRNFNSRRNFLRKGLHLGVGLGLALYLPELAHAAPQVWTSEQWWPIWAGKRNERGTLLHTLDEVGGPLHVYDVTYNTHSREWQEELVRQIKEEYPRDTWMGSCGPLAIAGMTAPKPIGSRNFDQITKEGLLVASVAHYTTIDIGIARMIDSINQGNAVFIELSEVPGEQWYRCAYEISGNQVKGTNYGFAERFMPISKIKWAALPYNPDEIDISTLDPRQYKLSYHLKNPELDRNKVTELLAA